MNDQIIIKNLLLRAIIGIKPDERIERQDILVNLDLRTDLRKVGKTDDLTDTLNYRTVTKKVIEMVETSQYHLIEKLAEEIANLCLEFRQVELVRVSVEKPHALRFAESVGVTIERARHG